MWIRKWNRTGYLVEIAVDRSRQRQGIGIALLDKLSSISAESGLRAIIVETQPSNRDAMDFYLSRGLRMCGYNDRYYSNRPESSKDIAIFLSLDLE